MSFNDDVAGSSTVRLFEVEATRVILDLVRGCYSTL